MTDGLNSAYLEQQNTAVRFLERLHELGVWLPQPSIQPTRIQFQFFRYQLPSEAHFGMNDEKQNQLVVDRFRQAARAIGGRWEKNDPTANSYEDAYYTFTSVIKVGTADVQLLMERDTVCERVKTGKKVEKVTEARPAQERKVEMVDEEERECKPLFKHAEAELDAAMNSLEASPESLEDVMDAELVE